MIVDVLVRSTTSHDEERQAVSSFFCAPSTPSFRDRLLSRLFSCLLQWLVEECGLELGGHDVCSSSGNDADTYCCSNERTVAAVDGDATAVVLFPFDDETARCDSIPTITCACCSCGGGDTGDGDGDGDDGGDPGFSGYCGGGENSHPLPMATVVSAGGEVEETSADEMDVCVFLRSPAPPPPPPSTDEATKESLSALMVVDTVEAAVVPPLCALPVDEGDMLLPLEARPPWELAATFKLVACERVLPSPSPLTAAAITATTPPTTTTTATAPPNSPGHKRKAAPGRRRKASARLPR